MVIIMDMFVLGAVAILAAMGGFWAGRSVQWQLVEAEGAVPGEDDNVDSVPQGSLRDRASGMVGGIMERRRPVKVFSPGREIGSPVTGQVAAFDEDGSQKIKIMPDYGKVYAPAAGRIAHLYPMGSAMLLRTEFGVDIMLQVGSHVDEMCSSYYHCRVMEHEIVRKGALLLEYDPAAVSSEGASPEIILSVENAGEMDRVTMAGQGRMKAGEPVLYVACKEGEAYESRR